MSAERISSSDGGPESDAIAIHLLKALTTAQQEERRITLDDLVAELGVRRAEVRSTLSTLHRQGYLDVSTMRLTLAGFALGRAVADAQLIPLRQSPERRVCAA